MLYRVILLAITAVLSFNLHASGNEQITSFNKAKKILERNVYDQVPRTTIYCLANFNNKKKIVDKHGFTTTKHKKRQSRIEWEHVVPAENFGRGFTAWREGDSRCTNKKGKSFKGRRCAEKVNKQYRYMQADMYNLYPAIGAVNALRSNYNFVGSSHLADSQFGSCPIKIANRKVEPPGYARGQIARAYLYMESAYPGYRIGNQKRELQQWDKQYPVTVSECQRTKLIEQYQKNENNIVKPSCIKRGLW